MPSLLSSSTSTTIPASAMPLISPPALLHAHLTQTPPLRPSSRLPTDCRPLALNTSSLTHANGSSLLRAGATTIICGVRAELLPVSTIADYRVKKTTDLPATAARNGNGEKQEAEEEDYAEVTANHLLVPNIELNTGCSPSHLPGSPPSIEAQTLSHRLLTLLHLSKIVRKEELKIYYSHPSPDADTEEEDEEEKQPELKAYWVLYIDMICIGHDGNLFDVAWLALCAALRDTLLPRAWWDADLAEVRCSAETSEASRLSLRGMPVPLSWGVFVPEGRTSVLRGKEGAKGAEETWVLCDLDRFEEECCAEGGCVVVDLNSAGRVEILKLEMNGGARVGGAELKNLLAIAEERWSMWQKILKAG